MHSQEPTPTISGPRALIVTALPVESQAVCAHLEQVEEVVHKQGSIYKRGLFTARDKCWELFVVEAGPTNTPTAVETERAIREFDPQLALFVGVAAGLKDVTLGDVVAASAVYNYESGKEAGELRSRPKGSDCSHALVHRARAEANSEQWMRRIKGRRTERPPRVRVGPIVAGEKVLSDIQGAAYQFIRRQYDDALAAEMEGSGFMVAARANAGVDAIVIRGISDLVAEKSKSDASGWQDVASRHASAFAFEIISKHVTTRFTSSAEETHAPENERQRRGDNASYKGKFGILLAALGGTFLAYKALIARPPATKIQPAPQQTVLLQVGGSSNQQKSPVNGTSRPSRPQPTLIGPLRTVDELRAITTASPTTNAPDSIPLKDLAPGRLAFIQPWNISPTAEATPHRNSRNIFEVHHLPSGQFILVGHISRQDASELKKGTRLLNLLPDTNADDQSVIGIPFEMIQSTQVQNSAQTLKDLRVELAAP